MLVCAFGYAQELPEIVQPEPTAFELTKYGEFPVGLNTGTPSISVPLLSYRTNNITVPISLSYSSNGVKVDQLSSNVGLGWSLNVGGVISRIVRGKEDENYRLQHPIREITRADLLPIEALPHQPTFSDNIDVDPDIVKFLHDVSEDNGYDSQSDLFSFNILGRSGKIVMDNTGRYSTIPHMGIKIIRDLSAKNGFVLITEDGVKYSFYDEEVIYNRTVCDKGAPTPPEQGYTTSWYLSKIEHPNGDVVNFLYESNQNNQAEELYQSSISQSLELPSSYPIYNPNFSATQGVITCRSYNRIIRKRLIEISSENTSQGKIVIDNNYLHPDPSLNNYRLVNSIKVLDNENTIVDKVDLSYYNNTNNRVFLNKVQFKESTNNYTFQYNDRDGLPARFSFKQDYWGYYNGKNNQSLLPDLGDMYPLFSIHTNTLADRRHDPNFSKKGMLTKIVYPTKGYTSFEYEPNTYYGDQTTVSDLYYSVSHRGNFKSSKSFYVGNYNNNNDVVLKLNYQVDSYVNTSEGCYDYARDKAAADLRIYEVSGGTRVATVYEKSFTQTTGSSNFQEEVAVSHSKNYEIEISHFGKLTNCIEASATVKLSSSVTQKTNVVTGGNRIKYIRNFDNNNTSLDVKRYYYSDKNNLGISSGDAHVEGLGHVSSRTAYMMINLQMQSQSYKTLNSTGSFPITNSGSNNIYYKNVTVSQGGDSFENGGVHHVFNSNRDTPGEQLLGEPNTPSTFTNFGWNHGLEEKTEFFKKPNSINDSKVVVKEVINDYKLDRSVSSAANYVVSKDYNIVISQPQYPTYKCKAGDLTRKTPKWQCKRDHKHAISGSSFSDPITYYSSNNGNGPITLGELKCKSDINNGWTAPDNQIIGYIYHECYNKNVDDVVSFPQIIRNLNVYKYENKSYWHYLNKTTERIYDVNGQNPIETVTDFYYDNFSHLQQTRVETKDSKGYTTKKTTKYAHDVNNQRLIDEHRIAEPIQVETSKVDGLIETKLGQQNTLYKDYGNGLYLPEKVQTSKGNAALEDRIVYHTYDDKGNPVEVSKKGGSKIYYVWGYQKTQPIAKIEGYTSISSTQLAAINAAIAASNLDISSSATSENDLRNSLTALRGAFPEAQVTSFTYDTLIGITSITDPRGYTIFYVYDDFNRLKQIKDKDGNILEENQYRYKN